MSLLLFSEEVLMGTMGVPNSQNEKHASQMPKQDMLKQGNNSWTVSLFSLSADVWELRLQ